MLANCYAGRKNSVFQKGFTILYPQCDLHKIVDLRWELKTSILFDAWAPLTDNNNSFTCNPHLTQKAPQGRNEKYKG